ncbi:YbhB/YbcL family Raf kinase inhibitor-like protein [Dissulfurirhabdus thermomarina]|uniref:YbhB/YbcL family Raf kinase inhibitor-like protein n=2 Tax=Dissulfurirhabdus thermomarina TaxID=1765737 RepID=A0A6N9TPY2_DISTH|nr:YbhB/YbcL family Raf kinase inhibitor-like protein [Dissulfurirhabdus thermomarina]NDY42500.1 YbhB/YbcL family Raf kinase inhibitor-like protein [Dissulfurirhabdus thermomarina]NMX24188.1 YbhB/YbcL family Raf kinase inhibitor-like protein [Dissulfurirhabdus thermomarina]
MELSSPAFTDGATLPIRFARAPAGGRNLSPPLAWSAPPEGTRSLALAVVDPHPVARNWVHWLVVDIPPETRALAEGASPGGLPPGARELVNSFGQPGYGGPQPPPGTGPHPYVFTLYALKVRHLDLPDRCRLADFQAAIRGAVLAESRLTGYLGR